MSVSLERLSAFYDREVESDEERAIAAHVAACASCQATLESWRHAAHAITVTAAVPLRRSRFAAVALAGIVALLVVGSGAALATGWFSEVFRAGDVSAAASRGVTLEEARGAQLPLPRSSELPGGWVIKQIQMTITPGWRSVDVQYGRAGSRPMGVTTWSSGITVNPIGDPSEVITVSGVRVEVRYHDSAGTARFVHRDTTVIIRAFQPEVDADALRSLVAAWLTQAN